MTPIQISTEFKAQAKKAILSILFFMFTYLVLLILAVALTVACVLGGIGIIIAVPKFITLVLGIGLASFGLLILFFLLKFMFKSHKTDRSHLHEITREDEPELFRVIDDIVREVGTKSPKKVYLSTDVNAAVFYDSNFWSMFLPIRKNLQIGLGLVNAVSKSELKAILSHEFGHFSQETMKVGSYVYNMNQVIFNMLYDNEGYESFIGRWAGITAYFAIFVILAVKIVAGIQWILRKQYALLNKTHMGLSREMEFQADEIAANVTGFEPLKNSLLRLPLADHSLNAVLSFCEGKISHNLKSENIYPEHAFVMNFQAEQDMLQFKNGFPEVTLGVLNRFDKSKLVIKNQWASHPNMEERVERLEKTGLKVRHVDWEPANNLFKHIGQTQKELTAKMYSTIQFQAEPKFFTVEEFQTEYTRKFYANTFSKIYNGYYDHKNPLLFEIAEACTVKGDSTLKELFSDQVIDLVYTAIALQNDIETLNQIVRKEVNVKTFDYDGVRYRGRDTRELLPRLDAELKQLNEQIRQNDMEVFAFFKRCAESRNSVSRLEGLYHEFFAHDKNYDTKYKVYECIAQSLQFVNVQTPFEEITANFAHVRSLETCFKDEIREMLDNARYAPELTNEIRENLKRYLSKEWVYFDNQEYCEGNLEVLTKAMNHYVFLLSRGYFLIKKELLVFQEELIVHGQ